MRSLQPPVTCKTRGQRYRQPALRVIIAATVMAASAGILNAESVTPVAAAKQGTYFLEMQAKLPADLGREAIRQTVWVDGKQVRYRPGDRHWDVGYVPYFTVEHRTEDGPADLLFLQPIELGDHAKVEIHSAAVPAAHPRLRPAMAGIDAAMKVTGGAMGIFFAGEGPRATVSVTGPAGKSVRGKLIFQRLRLADGWGARKWQPGTRVTEAARLGERPVQLTFSRAGQASFQADLPDDRNGLVGLTLVLEDGPSLWAKYLGAAAIVPRRDVNHYHADGPFIASLGIKAKRGHLRLRHGKHRTAEGVVRAFKKIGIDWVRCGPNWSDFEPKPGRYDWSGSDLLFNLLRRHHIYALHIAAVAPRWAQTPVEDRIKDKFDTAPSVAHLDDWRKAYEAFYRRYKDVVRAVNVWNEPWEGGGITGWRSTGEHYRKLVRGIRQAVDAADPSIMVVAADSGQNTDWKLFAAGMQDAIDVISTHYASPKTSPAFAMKKFYHKQLWETETWRAWQGDAACARHALEYFANGGDKVSLWNTRMLFDARNHPTPAVVWTAAMRHMLRGTHFREPIHPKTPPFVLLFAGQDRQVAAVTTSLQAQAYQHGGFREQFAGDRVRMILNDAKGLKFYDLLANPIEPRRDGDRVILPIDRGVRYIAFQGSVEAFEQRLADARYEGMRPVSIVLYDLTNRLGKRAQLRVTLRNAYHERIRGTVRVEADGLQFDAPEQKVDLPAAGETTLSFTVTTGKLAANRFPTRVTVHTDHGDATHEEPVYVAVIARGTPTIDGEIAEWRSLGAVPVLLSQGKSATVGQLDAWFPWEKLQSKDAPFTARIAFAADDEALYMMARVHDESRHILPSMLAGKNLHQFEPKAPYMYVKAGPTPAASGDLIQIALGAVDDDPFQPKYEVFPPDSPWYHAGSYISTQYKYLLYPTADGGAEVMRMRTPDFYYIHPLPIDYGFLAKHCSVPGAKIRVKRTEHGYQYEAALPWSELKTVPHALGKHIRLSVLVQNDSMKRTLEWSRDRSVASLNALDFEPGWGDKWSSETQWTFVGKK